MDQEWDGDWVLSASIFDVSDLSDPRLKDRLLLDAGGSEASVDHHAFTYDPDTGYVAIPSTDASGDTVLEILKADTAITHVGSVDQPDSWGDPTCIPIRRSIRMDGEKVWAYSAGGLKAVDLADPSLVEAKFQFTDVDPCL